MSASKAAAGIAFTELQNRQEATNTQSGAIMKRDLAWAIFSIAALLVMTAIALLGWQVYDYIKFGDWTSISVVSSLKWANIPGASDWAVHPSHWIGLHKILTHTLASAMLIAIGIPIWIVSIGDWLQD